MNKDLTNEDDGLWYTVKWYNPYKGYGFVTEHPEGESSDIFLHFSVLESVDLMQVRQGDKIRCEIAPTDSGVQVTDVFEFKAANPFLAESDRLKKGKKINPPRFMIQDDHAPVTEEFAEVKWFSRVKGFGFARVKSMKKDVFIHGALLEELNIVTLKPGTKVKLAVAVSVNGPEARKLVVLD